MSERRHPPHNTEAEAALLGSLLIDRDAVIAVAPLLQPEDFYRSVNGVIYKTILDLYNRREPPDIVTVTSELERMKELEGVGGISRLMALVSEVVTSVHATHYAGVIKRASLARQVIHAGTQIVRLGFDESLETPELLNQAQAAIHGVAQARGSGDFVPINVILEEYFNKLDTLSRDRGQVVGVPSGHVDIDGMTGGFQKGDLIILAARPGVGKTSFSLGVAYSAALMGKKVAIFNMEMPAEQLIQRLLAMETGIDSHRLRMGHVNDDEWDKLSHAFGVLSELPIYVDDSPGMSIMEMRAKTRRMQAEEGVDFVQVDYLQLMHGGGKKGSNRQEEVSDISRGLKEMARELHVPVLAMAQLSRSVESRTSHVPMLSDLRESGSIEQDADIVSFLVREELYDAESEKKGLAEFHIAKHRNGGLGVVSLRFFDKTTRFADLEVYRS
jgi:replicative DNA helicase